jgi:hypothetical protein
MNNPQHNKYNMYVASRTVLHKHQALWTPLTGFADAVNDLDAQLAIITGLAQVQIAPNGGAALKKTAKDSLIETAYELAAATRAYAIVNKNAELAAELDYSEYDLGKGRPQAVMTRCLNIWSTATDNQAASAAFGVTAAKLAALKQRIDAFEAADPKPRTGRTAAKAATDALPDAFAQVDEILNDCLDGLMAQFKSSSTEFYNEYFAARTIVDTPSTRTRKATPPPAPVPTPA